MKTLSVHPIQTRLFVSGENLLNFVCESIPDSRVSERMVLAVTSKIVSLAERRLIARESIDKTTLVRQEADLFLGEVAFGCFLTVKEGLFIPSAGIDESNSAKGDFILYPSQPFESARLLWQGLRERWSIQELGVILTDSHTSPLRRGVTGVCLAYAGFKPVRNLIGKKDLYGRELQMTQMNLADGWSAASVSVMGEGSEQIPLAILSGMDCDFCETVDQNELKMPMHEDLYAPFFQKSLG